jgi:hypothetical protein
VPDCARHQHTQVACPDDDFHQRADALHRQADKRFASLHLNPDQAHWFLIGEVGPETLVGKWKRTVAAPRGPPHRIRREAERETDGHFRYCAHPGLGDLGL